jgi:uncharacterized protein YbaR (Trm112 family)
MHPSWFDVLQCPTPHAPSSLIAAASKRVGTDVIDGELGCPICGATYRIEAGRVVFAETSGALAAGAIPSDDDVVRLAALLDLTVPGTRVALASSWAEHARPLVVMTEPLALLVNPPPLLAMGEGLAGISGVTRLPLARASVRGIALDVAAAEDPVTLASWISAVRPGGRVVGPAQVAVPDGVTLLARDARHWVGEATTGGPSAFVPLRRAGP